MLDEGKNHIISCRDERTKIIDSCGIYCAKFVTAINAGGAIAVMGFMGAIKKVNAFHFISVSSYLIGIVLMGLVLRTLFDTHLKFRRNLTMML